MKCSGKNRGPNPAFEREIIPQTPVTAEVGLTALVTANVKNAEPVKSKPVDVVAEGARPDGAARRPDKRDNK